MNTTNTTDTQAADSIEDIAKREARKLAALFCGKSHATAMELDGSWYIVTSGTGEGADFAYEPEEVEGTLDAEGWDYSHWCNSTGPSPVTERKVAAAYYLATESNLGEPGSCVWILSDSDLEMLDIAKGLLVEGVS